MVSRLIFYKLRYVGVIQRPWLRLILYSLFCLSLCPFADAKTQPLIETKNHFEHIQSTTTITDLDFFQTAGRTAVSLILFEGPIPKIQRVKTQGTISVTLTNTQLDEGQLVTMDVTDFGAIVSRIETFSEGRDTRIDLTYTGAVEVTSTFKNNTLRINVKPNNEERHDNTLSNGASYTGNPISSDFQDVPVRRVLQIIAQLNEFNLVIADTVSGNVTINLSGVPWDQALDMILRVKGLDKRLEGDILLVAPADELFARETQSLQSIKQASDLAPLHTVSIAVNYAKAVSLATILKSQEGGILSIRGGVSVDERTNTLLIRDTLASINEARKTISALDVPVRQVLIESRMVTVLDNVGEQLGVRWGFNERQQNNSLSGTIEGAQAISDGTLPPISERLNVNLPVTGAAGSIGFQVANLLDGTILDLELSALESENKGEIIASPRITVANQHEAYIEQGTEIPYVQSTANGATSVEFKKAVLSLKVTPHITPDNHIILDLVVTQDTRGETVKTSTGDAVAIDTQEIKTQVFVKNGETIVLGGIFQQTSSDRGTKVPVLGDLPVIGALFRNTSVLQQKRELLVFVTPKIVTEPF